MVFVLVGVVCCLAVYIFVPDFHNGYLLYGFPPILYVIVADAMAVNVLRHACSININVKQSIPCIRAPKQLNQAPGKGPRYTGNYGGGVFASGQKACGMAQLATNRPLCQRKTGADWKKVLANLWSRKNITKKAHSGRGQETKWKISNEMGFQSDAIACYGF